MDVRFSITIRHTISSRSMMDGAADVAETTYTPFQMTGCRAGTLIVRRVKPAPGSQLALFATYSYHGFITDREDPNWS